MSSDWSVRSLGDLCSAVYSGGTPTSTKAEYYGGSIPWLRTKEVNYEKIYSTEAHITQLGFANSSAKIVPPNSVIVAMYGNGDTAGRAAINKVPLTTNQACCNLVVDPTRADYRFVYYSLMNSYQALVDLKNGGAQQNLNGKLIRQFSLMVPGLHTQCSIADLLEALDDRITVLRESNATLEAIAQALFKSWFVDFDPVRAKMEGRVPEGMGEATAALFPDGIEESELGEVPRGWSLGKVSDFAKLHKGTINPLIYPETTFEHFSLPAFDEGRMPASEPGSAIKSNKTSVPPDAVLLSKLNPHIPRVWLPNGSGRHAVCSTEFLVFVPSGRASREFLYCAFSNPAFQEKLCQLVTGTSNSHQRVKPDGVSNMKAVVPDSSVLEAFTAVAGVLLAQVGQNQLIVGSLSRLRDILLPRLISGQLRLAEIEAKFEELAD